MIVSPDPLEYFQLRPVKAAKVSEISEATAAAPVPDNEKVNFHIGNPIQDSRLRSFYFRLTTGLPSSYEKTPEFETAGWSGEQAEDLRFFEKTLSRSVPYLPRGGYTREHPGKLIDFLKEFFSNEQQEPLRYEFGEKSGERECILESGGIWEALRVLLTALSRFLLHLPAQIVVYGLNLPGHLREFPNLQFHNYDGEEETILPFVSSVLSEHTRVPTYFISGRILSERIRRSLRMLSLDKPLYFIETNNAPNHLSMAREAKMLNRVTRFITPSLLNPELRHQSVVIILGNSDLLKILELVHFELKGTPSAAEVDYLTFRLDHALSSPGELLTSEVEDQPPHPEPQHIPGAVFRLHRFSDRMLHTFQEKGTALFRITDRLEQYSHEISRKLNHLPHFPQSIYDSMSDLSPAEMFRTVFPNLDDPSVEEKLESGLLNHFLKIHPYYNLDACMVVSGSARTAMSLLGFHCGIRSVLIPDLSWTYEHCFPHVETVSLNDRLGLDTEAIRARILQNIQKDPDWKSYGAVVFNSPHNASGQVFDAEDLKALLKWLLDRDIYVIDDLSYQNLRPADNGASIPTMKQLVNDLIQAGYVNESRRNYLLTIHSLSKTDCFAGARLAVIEIPDPVLREKFRSCNRTVRPNIMAIFSAYLFYRNDPAQIRHFWNQRNAYLNERMRAIESACDELPVQRNPFHIRIVRPAASMYPQMIIEDLPHGISLDWLASNLAKRGIGLVPLSTFARTAKGYELARKTFRMTLGGVDGPARLRTKTRRVLIDLNRLIADEEARYNRKLFSLKPVRPGKSSYLDASASKWNAAMERIRQSTLQHAGRVFRKYSADIDWEAYRNAFESEFLSERLDLLLQKYRDQFYLFRDILSQAAGSPGTIIRILEREFYKEHTEDRQDRFRHRLFDRTVHPTQMYALQVDLRSDELLNHVFFGTGPAEPLENALSTALIHEYLGSNIAINSTEEADELVCDLRSIMRAEDYARWNGGVELPVFLSFWGDWDGSTRPSGQGHRLVAGALLENVTLMADIIRTLMKYDRDLNVPADLIRDIERLDANKEAFRKLSNKITLLTNQLENRYRSILPFSTQSGRLHRFAMKAHLARDPLTALWQHNDRLEKRMFELREDRRSGMEYYFALNKKLRKFLHGALPRIERLLVHPEVALKAGSYRSLLKRFILTPRIHQKMILSQDQFAIDTTVHNMLEINQIASAYGTPGMVLALQVSMSTEPEALISLDTKLRAGKEQLLRENPDIRPPNIWLVPLFEDTATIQNLTGYLERIWNYAIQSRRIDQDTAGRFSDMICELFIAGSDISQQVGQAQGAILYRDAKHKAVRWLAERGLVERVRMKFGSGEPMQRQGGYYDTLSGREPFWFSSQTAERFRPIKPSIRKSAEYARIPLMGVFSSGDLRTFQSMICEKVRHLPAEEYSQLLHHLMVAQHYHDNELIRASEPLLDTRLIFRERGLQELELLTTGKRDPVYDEFCELVTANFRQILYGLEKDVVGIHVIAYFISRALPTLRDRPTVRPSRDVSEQRGQKIIARIAQTLPLASHGSLLRAIGHNRAQTMILGVNQLTTGLFRALDEFSNRQSNYSDRYALITDRILPNLPVREILQTLRLYHDPQQEYLKRMEQAFPAGNSCFTVLREDLDAISGFIGYFQRELVRRLGIDAGAFFENGTFDPVMLPTLDPELAVLLQPDLFNMNVDLLIQNIGGTIPSEWKAAVTKLLNIPVEVRAWRASLWDVIGDTVFKQSRSFVELAEAIYALSSEIGQAELPFTTEPTKVIRLGSQVADLLRGIVDDSMRQFLLAAVQYLTQLPKSMTEVPIDIIRALRDVERIVKLEEQAFSEREQNLIRFYMTQMARVCQENG